MNAAADPDVFEAAVEAGPPPPVALAELASALWRRKGLILACGAAALLLAGAVLSRLPDRYVAQAEVLLEARAPRVVEFDQVLPAAPFDAQAVQSEIRLIQSQQLLSRVARKLRLAEVEEFSGRTAGAALPARLSAGLRERARELARTWLGWTPAAAPAPAPDQADRRAVAELRRRLDVRQQDLSRVIAVRMTSADAATAALLANAVADQYIVDQLEAKFEATERAAAWLTERLTGISARLERAEAEAEALRARLAADPAGAPGAARRRLAELAAALAAEEAAARGRGPGASRAARRAEAIRSSIASLEAETRGRADGEIALRQLDREAEALAALHEGFLSRLKETRAQTGLERPDARLIAEAAAPLEPSRPNARIAMALALTAGLGLGAAAALLRESVAGVHHSTEAAERDAGLPVLAALPRPERRGEDPVAAARRRPSSRLAEAVRDLRARALPPAFLSARAAPTPRDSVALAVVSPGPGEGKSTLAALLAESCARLGRRTVLLDGDLRAPSHAERLGLAAETDIGALLEGSAELDEVLWLDPETGVSILPAMPSDAPRADLLADAGAGPLIAALKARFDVVIVDTPPLLAVADGRLLAAEADRCIVALRWGETEREALRAALRALAEAGARPLGLALTATPRRADPRPGRRGANARYERFGAYFEE